MKIALTLSSMDMSIRASAPRIVSDIWWSCTPHMESIVNIFCTGPPTRSNACSGHSGVDSTHKSVLNPKKTPPHKGRGFFRFRPQNTNVPESHQAITSWNKTRGVPVDIALRAAWRMASTPGSYCRVLVISPKCCAPAYPEALQVMIELDGLCVQAIFT